MQKGFLSLLIAWLGIALLIAWYITFSVLIFKYSDIIGIFVSSIFFWLPFVFSLILIIMAWILLNSVKKDAVGKVLKVERVYSTGIVAVRYSGRKIFVITNDRINKGDYVKITGLRRISGAYSRNVIEGKKIEPGDPEFPE